MAPRRSLVDRAGDRIKKHGFGGGGSLFLAVTPGFRHARRSPERAVGRDAPEVAAAEQAIWGRLGRELGFARLSLQEWVKEAGAAAGGLPKLAAELLGIPFPATHKERRANKPFAAELRKLQEYAEGKYQNASGARRERIKALGGPGNPYASQEALISSVRGVQIAVAGHGDLLIAGYDARSDSGRHTDPVSLDELAGAIADDGAGLLGWLEENAIDPDLEFTAVQSLEMQWG